MLLRPRSRRYDTYYSTTSHFGIFLQRMQVSRAGKTDQYE